MPTLKRLEHHHPGDIGTTTPDYTSMQGYRAADPNQHGLHVLIGHHRKQCTITDCEYGFNETHEDLMDQDITMEANKTIPSWVASYGWDDHGTAVIGQIAAGNNGYGVTGLAYDAIVNFNPEYTNEDGGRRVDSIASAIDMSVEGDIILLEMQAQASYISGTYLFGPAELDPNVWTITKSRNRCWRNHSFCRRKRRSKLRLVRLCNLCQLWR